MNRIKRIMAMALAVMIVLPMAGSVIGSAADTATIESNKGPASTWIAGSADMDFEFTVKDVQNGLPLVDADVPVGTTLTIASDSDFETGVGTLKIDKVIPPDPGVTTGTVKYLVKADGLKHKSASATAKLKFTVTYKANGAPTVVTVTVPKMSTSSGGGGTPPPPEDTSSNARYTLRKVSSPKNGSGTPLPASPPRYDIDNITSSSDATVRQNYFADISVKFSDANLPVGASQLVVGDVDTSDLGSFVYDSASPVEVRNASGGYCEIVFKNIRYTGNGKKLAFRVDNGDYSKDIVASLSECVTRQEANANTSSKPSDDDDDSKIESETPYVIINQYGYGGGTVTAGETFNLSLTFLNTSDTIDVSNMMITVTMPTDLMLTSSSNTFYVPMLETQKSITKSVQVTAKVDAKALSHNIGASMKYQYIDHRVNTRRSAETTENIAIPVVQVDRFQVTAVEIPMDIMMEEETSVTVSFVNKGRSEAYNLSASIDGNILNPGQTQNLGNLLSGATGTADFFVKPSAVGQLNGNITITYEDTNMEEKTATIPYNATVKTMEEMNGGGMIGGGGMFPGGEMIPGEGEVMPEDAKPQWPIFVIIGVAVLIPTGIVAKKIIDKKRKEREDADL